MDLKKTPLYETHLKYGGKIIDFEGWALPVQFSSIIEEHHAVRKAAGLFDVSDMGEVEIKGKDAQALIEKLVTNRVSTMVDGQVRYSPMCNEKGGVVDDLLIYRFGPEHFMLVINAGNIDKDYNWIQKVASGFPGATVRNISAETAELALQGPNSEKILKKLTDVDLSSIGYYYFVPEATVAGKKCVISRTGYTGEDGFELYCAPADAPALWDDILEAGQDLGCVPAGLGCRDTLRFEASMPLYGQEMDDDTTPLDAGLGRFVDLEKPDFIGKEALLKEKAEGLRKKLVGFEMVGRGVPRTGYPIVKDGERVGYVTTGSFAPTLNKNLGLGFVRPDLSNVGTQIGVEIRGKSIPAVIVKKPFYKRG
ncbi:MAG TPA: glycine cleavage system aminomethyltransferase GcvT [Clostridia bacterium]|nr:glycine cleavage system aminomethyltransferase GcvT [Clostridia bacterium]